MGNCISQAANKLSASKELPTSFPSPNETAASSKQSQGITEQQPQQLIKAVKAAEPDRQESGTQPSTPAALAAARADKATADRASTKKPRSPIKSQPTRFFQLLAEPDERIQHDQIRSASYDILLMESPAGSAHLKDAPDGGHAFHITRLAGRIASRQDSTKDMDAELLKLLVGDIYIHPEWLTLKHKIGEGAFALVEKHTLRRPVGDAKAKAVVAVKKLKPAVIASQSELKEFVQEANVLRKLQHRNIVDFQGIGAADTSSPQAMRLSMFLVQEFVGGGTLKQLIVRQNRSASQRPIYSRQDALRWATQLAEAFQYLHTHRPMIIHRDLKLDNVLLTNRRPGKADAKLADFGLHRMIKDLSTRVPMPDVIAAKPDPSVDRSAASCRTIKPSLLSRPPLATIAPVLASTARAQQPQPRATAEQPTASVAVAVSCQPSGAPPHASGPTAQPSTTTATATAAVSAGAVSGADPLSAQTSTGVASAATAVVQPASGTEASAAASSAGQSVSGAASASTAVFVQPLVMAPSAVATATAQISTTVAAASPALPQQAPGTAALLGPAPPAALTTTGTLKVVSSQPSGQPTSALPQAPPAAALTAHTSSSAAASAETTAPVIPSEPASAHAAALLPGAAIVACMASQQGSAGMASTTAAASITVEAGAGTAVTTSDPQTNSTSPTARWSYPTASLQLRPVPKSPFSDLAAMTSWPSELKPATAAVPVTISLTASSQNTKPTMAAAPVTINLAASSQSILAPSDAKTATAAAPVTINLAASSHSMAVAQEVQLPIQLAQAQQPEHSTGAQHSTAQLACVSRDDAAGTSPADLSVSTRGDAGQDRRASSRPADAACACPDDVQILISSATDTGRGRRTSEADARMELGSAAGPGVGRGADPAAGVGLATSAACSASASIAIAVDASQHDPAGTSTADAPSVATSSTQSATAGPSSSLRHTSPDRGRGAAGVAPNDTAAVMPVASSGHAPGAAAGPSSSRSSDAAKSTVAVAPADRPASMSAGSSASTPSGAVQNPLDGKLHPGRTDPMANAASSSGRGDAQAKAEVTWAYKMTGQTGSLMYMAPEVLLTTIYNEKVDVFSFAVILFELLSYRTSLSMLPQPVSMDQAYRYAHKVANGYRRPLPAYWPEELRVLIADCWAAHPSQRPSFADVAARLADMKAKGITETWDAQERAGRPGCVVQ